MPRAKTGLWEFFTFFTEEVFILISLQTAVNCPQSNAAKPRRIEKFV